MIVTMCNIDTEQRQTVQVEWSQLTLGTVINELVLCGSMFEPKENNKYYETKSWCYGELL